MIRRAAILAVALALAAPCAVRAQQLGGPETGTGLVLEGSYRLSRLQGRSAKMLGGAALLTLGPRISFGLAGWSLFKPITVGQTGGVENFGFAYGGAVGELRLATRNRYQAKARLLVGAGNGKLTLPVVGTEIESDNFGVMEPELVGSMRVVGPLRLTAAVGYRMVYGVQDLPGIAQRDLWGWTTRVSLGLHLF